MVPQRPGRPNIPLVSLLGMLTTLESSHLAWIDMAAVIVLTTLMNLWNLQLHRDRQMDKQECLAYVDLKIQA
jgi:hypothetical protein